MRDRGEFDWSRQFSAQGGRAAPSEIQELMKILDRPGLISLAGGIPDAKLFPIAEIAAAHRRILDDPKRSGLALQYTHSEGFAPLREWLAGDWRRQGIDCGQENILVTSGAQQALDLVARLFLDNGDRLLTAPTLYIGALQAFGNLAPAYGELAELQQPRAPAAKLAYVMPDFANPTGLSMNLDERRALLEGAQARNVVLVEDGTYASLNYDGPPPASLMALSAGRSGAIDGARVIYCGTFSKSLAPGLRVGWIVAPAAVIRRLVLLKQASDLYTSLLAQMVLFEVVCNLGDTHGETLRRIYGMRRDAMLSALSKYMPGGVDWTKPGGGMFVWLTLPPECHATELCSRALEEENLAFIPGSAFYARSPSRNTVRLSFCLNDPETNAQGVERLARLVAR
jgi:DNA-binding transcriptional MocR family regulator